MLADGTAPPRVVDVDGAATMPSAVFAEDDGAIVVGRDAERKARLDPTRFEPNPKRRIDEQRVTLGGDVISVSEALGAVLRRVLEEASRQLGGGQPDEVRLTHPAQWGQDRCAVLRAAARDAGVVGRLRLVPEPVAAAAHFASLPGRTLAPGQALAVYDLGAGTVDVAVVAADPDGGFRVLAEDGLADLGGIDVDEALLMHIGRQVSHTDPRRWQGVLRPTSVTERRARRMLRDDVKAAKEALSRHERTQVLMLEPFADVQLTRAELEALVRPAMLRGVELMARTLRAAGLSPGGLAGIALVGGSSRLPLVGSMISEKLGVVPVSMDQPEAAVAFGALRVAADHRSVPPRRPSAATISGPHAVPAARAEQHGMGQVGYAPAMPPGPHTGRATRPAVPGSGSSHPLVGFPAPRQPSTRSRVGRRLLLSGLAAVLVAAAIVGGVLLGGSATTYAAAECERQTETDARGFTGCLRQLAGSIAEHGDCAPRVSRELAPASRLGPIVGCATPGLPGGQLAYMHSESDADARDYAEAHLTALGTGLRVSARWRGNGLDGSYLAADDGDQRAVLVFMVSDRPLVGVLRQDTSGNAGADGELRRANALADYFEERIQPGE
ncbi:Hsp70 family protein [Haloechinothrix salitolerans]